MTWVTIILMVAVTSCCFWCLVRGTPLKEMGRGSQIRSDVSDGSCEVTITDMRILLPEGGNLTYECDFYECSNGQIEADKHECDITLPYWKYDLCLQWSADGCCCEVVGCQDVHGVIKEEGTMYQTTLSSNPDHPDCGTFCLCQHGHRGCRIESSCFDVSVVSDVFDPTK